MLSVLFQFILYIILNVLVLIHTGNPHLQEEKTKIIIGTTKKREEDELH